MIHIFAETVFRARVGRRSDGFEFIVDIQQQFAGIACGCDA